MPGAVVISDSPVGDDEPARAHLDAIVGRQKIQLGGLSDGQDHGVAFDHRFAVFVEGRVEAARGVEHPFGLDHFQAGHAAIAADTTRFGPKPACITMPSASASSISSRAAGISSRRSRHTMLTSRAPMRNAESETSIISCVATAAMFSSDGHRFR